MTVILVISMVEMFCFLSHRTSFWRALFRPTVFSRSENSLWLYKYLRHKGNCLKWRPVLFRSITDIKQEVWSRIEFYFECGICSWWAFCSFLFMRRVVGSSYYLLTFYDSKQWGNWSFRLLWNRLPFIGFCNGLLKHVCSRNMEPIYR